MTSTTMLSNPPSVAATSEYEAALLAWAKIERDSVRAHAEHMRVVATHPELALAYKAAHDAGGSHSRNAAWTYVHEVEARYPDATAARNVWVHLEEPRFAALFAVEDIERKMATP